MSWQGKAACYLEALIFSLSNMDIIHVNDPAVIISQACEGGRWLQGYVRGKLRYDPIFPAAQTIISRSPLPIMDLGCGLGLLGLWLRIHGITSAYYGCDLSDWKIAVGNKAAERLGFGNFKIEESNMCLYPLATPSIVCALDVIHYLPPDVQASLIKKMALAAQDGSVVLLRTGVRGCGWRSGATLLEEWWTRWSGWIRGGHLNFPSLPALIRAFEAEGCRVKHQPLWGKTPFSSYWLEITAAHSTIVSRIV